VDSKAVENIVELDRAAVRIARSRGAIELALGKALARLIDRDGLIQLGYSRQADYARERLGVSPRTLSDWVRLARVLVDRPLLHRAVAAGAVSPKKALTVAPVAIGNDEATWVLAAMRLANVELECAVRAEGAEPATGYGAVESLVLRMTPEQQDKLDAAIALAQEQNGFASERWKYVEYICQEWLGAFGEWQPESARPRVAIELPRRREATPAERSGAAAVVNQLHVIALAAEPPEEGAGARALDAYIIQLMDGRRGFDTAFGAILARVSDTAAWTAAGFGSVEEYCRERLGISPRLFRQRVWLEGRMRAHPALRVALASGRLTYSKALIIAKDARPTDIDERIEEATCTTWQQMERESTLREERQNRANGIRRLWGPEDAFLTITDAIASAQAVAVSAGLGRVDSGQALAIIADHFVDVWTAHRRAPPARRRQEVLMRQGGLCAVPGCSRAAVHEHHIEFRSQGGSDDDSNLLGLCAVHHLRGIHGSSVSNGANLMVSGRAGERLEWWFGNGEAWVTLGDDDVSTCPPEIPEVRRRTG
jgi:hypothetical protein